MASRTLKIHRISFPEYSEYDDRLKSYHTASEGSYLREHAKKLAAAGFFYGGNSDDTFCFYCGGGVKDWRKEDIPWVEHAKWLSGCSFLLVNKGFDFIENHFKKNDYNEIETIKYPTQKTDRSDLQCIVCLTYEKNVLFLPCRHCCVCSECGAKLETCAVCREVIVSQLQIFLS